MTKPSYWPRRALSGAAALLATGAVSAAAAIAFGHVSARQFGVRYETLPLLASGQRPLRILHIGDMHLVKGDQQKIEFVRNLASLQPDLIINTGDNPGGVDAIDDVVAALEPLLQIPGVFVPGSNDYYGPRRANPLRYLRGPSPHDASHHHQVIDTKTMFRRLTTAGVWHFVANRRLDLRVRDDLFLTFAGTHDAHMQADSWPGFSTAPSELPTGENNTTHEPTRLKIAVTHAPYRHVLDAATADGADLILAGHTHGGQVALPWYGAIVSNCDLPTGLASGLSRWHAAGHTSLLNVTAGIGASPTVPLRTFCPPEAVVIDLVAGD